MGVRVGLVLFFISACLRHVLGLIFVNFIFFNMFKDRVLFTMYQYVCVWHYYDMVVSRVGINCSQL